MGKKFFQDIGVCILSWKGYDTLRNSLISFRDGGFFNLFNEFKIVLPEASEEGINLCKEFGIDAVCFEENLGILGGFEACAKALESKYIIILENDLQLGVNIDEAYRQINDALNAIKNGEIIKATFKHRDNPDVFDNLFAKATPYYPYENSKEAEKLKAFFRRLVRPGKALRKVGATVYYRKDADKICPKYIKSHKNGAYILDAKVVNWTNMAFLIEREFFLEKIINFAKSAKTTRRVNGFKNLEIEMNAPYWRNSGWKIMIHDGIFKHERKSYRGY